MRRSLALAMRVPATLAFFSFAVHVADAKMGTPCRSGNDCAVINTQRDIRQYTEQARRAASEAGEAMGMSQATSVAREAAVRVLEELSESKAQVASATVAKFNAEAAVTAARALEDAGDVENLKDISPQSLRRHHHSGDSRVVAMALGAVHAADEATAAGVAAAAARAAARSHEGAETIDVERAKISGEVRLIARMAKEAEDALAIAAEDERLHKYEAVLAEAQASSLRIQAQMRLAHHAAYEARHTARRIAISADDARARLAVMRRAPKAFLILILS